MHVANKHISKRTLIAHRFDDINIRLYGNHVNLMFALTRNQKASCVSWERGGEGGVHGKTEI